MGKGNSVLLKVEKKGHMVTLLVTLDSWLTSNEVKKKETYEKVKGKK